MELLEALAEAGVTISNFFSNDLLTSYQRRQVNKQREAERIEREQRVLAERMAEMHMTEEERIKANQKRDQQKAERQAYGDSIRNDGQLVITATFGPGLKAGTSSIYD